MNTSRPIPLTVVRVDSASGVQTAPRRAALDHGQGAGLDFLQFDAAGNRYLLLVDGSRVFRIPDTLADALRALPEGNHAAAIALLARHGLAPAGLTVTTPPVDPPLRALSLNLTNACNLGCGYCYADGGSFGGRASAMRADVAEAAVQRLIGDAATGDRVNVAFLGGEPLLNRPLLRHVTAFADALARTKGVQLRFAVTSNGTLLTPDDADFFARFRFSVTISLDGVGEVHDRQRPTRDGRGTYAQILGRLAPLLACRDRIEAGARVTVTPSNLDLRETLDQFIAVGFSSVGFSPMLAAPAHQGEMSPGDLDRFLSSMIACGREFERCVLEGRAYPFSNMMSALTEIHRGTARPYSCGAGIGYFGVSASGGLYACHRFVEDDRAAMGDVTSGVDRGRQAEWLATRLVDRQQPCGHCWARYLCGGGCHHEVMHRGRPACDYIRGWLRYVLQAYARLSAEAPDAFQRGFSPATGGSRSSLEAAPR